MAFRGLKATIPVGAQGQTGNKNQALVGPGHLLIANNISFESGTIRKEGGTTKYNSTAITGDPTILGGWDWWPDNAKQRMIVLCSDGKMYKDAGTGTFGTTLTTGLTVSGVNPVFVEAGAEDASSDRKLVMFTKGNIPQVLAADGNTVAAMGANKPADWATKFPRTGVMHGDRLWGFYGHRAYYSTFTDHEDFRGSGSGTVNVYPGEGQEIIAATSFKGLIIMWKYPRGIYIIDTNDPTTWRVNRISRSLGMASENALIQIEDDLLFMDSTGNFNIISDVTEFGNVGSTALGQEDDLSELIRDEMKLDALSSVQAIYYVDKREAHFAVNGIGSSVLNRRVVIDLNQRAPKPRIRVSDRDSTLTSLWLRIDSNNIERPVYGDNAGFVRNMDQTAREHDSTGFVGEFQTSHTDLAFIDPQLASLTKNGKFLEVVVEPKGNWNLAVDVYWDDKLTQTIQFNMGTTGGALGSFVLGTDTLAGSAIINKVKRLTGSGRRISLRGSNSGQAEDFSVSNFTIFFTPGNERSNP